MSDWYEEMERAEQEYDAKLADEARAYQEGYQQGKADAIEEILLLPKHNHYDNYGELMCQSIDVKDIEQVKEKKQ